MTEQTTTQTAQQIMLQTRSGWRRPGSGISGNPRGLALTKERIAAEIEILITAFGEIHHRAPTRVEAAMIGNAARLICEARRMPRNRPHSPENLVKLANASRRLLRSLGLDGVRASQSNGSVPWPSRKVAP
jgi:hypothetical protein